MIEEKINDDWSPEQISGWLLMDKDILISHERISTYLSG